jgi:glycosyltransferase involved in cell wall biosynthesis
MSSNILLIQTAIGDYRQAVLEIIREKLGDRFTVLCGTHYFDLSTKTKVSLGGTLQLVDNRFFVGRRLLWQSNVVLEGVRSNHVILEFNPRILSNWLILLIRRLLSKKSVLWGHAWGRGGQHSTFSFFRRLMRSLSHSLVVYTESQKEEVCTEGTYSGKVIAAPNALYRISEMNPAVPMDCNCFIYVGRLVHSKHPERMIDAFATSKVYLDGGHLLVVGEGPLLEQLKAEVARLQLEPYVTFFGHISDISELRRLYARSIFSISPGYVGLSITQSFGFGVPMIISKNEPHSPEIEAASEGVNSLFFDHRNPNHLCQLFVDAWKARDVWIARRSPISTDCRERYSAELMAQRLISSIN